MNALLDAMMKAHPGTDMHGTKIIPDPYGTVVGTRPIGTTVVTQ